MCGTREVVESRCTGEEGGKGGEYVTNVDGEVERRKGERSANQAMNKQTSCPRSSKQTQNKSGERVTT